MKTVDEILKIKATILYILRSFSNGIDYIKLFKIMYFAQQEHLVKYGHPIFDDTFHALNYGPVPSFSYRCFKIIENNLPVTNEDSKTFTNAFSIEKDSQLIFPKENTDMDELSTADIKTLNNTIEKYGKYNSMDLSKLSHDKAWKKTIKRMKINPEDDRIFIIDIAEAGNADKKMIDYIREIQSIKKALSF